MRENLSRVEKLLARQSLQWAIDHIELATFDSFDGAGVLHDAEDELMFVLLSFMQQKVSTY